MLRRDDGTEDGFTLVELLVVITILGILAAIVVFAVGGIGDKGQSAACKTDYTTIQTAEEAYFAKAGHYAKMPALTNAKGVPADNVPGPLLQSTSQYYTVATATAQAYTLKSIDKSCPSNPLSP